MADLAYYPSSNNFRNTVYSLDIAIENYYKDLLFKGDISRIVYASNANSLRERSRTQDLNNLNLPFMNYYLKKITPGLSRPWWNHPLNIDGMFIDELQRKFRMAPIRVIYESTVFFHRNDDTHQAMLEMFYNQSNETRVYPELEVDGQNIQLLAIEYPNLDFEPEYEQKDWFEKNRIHSIGINFEFDYNYIKDSNQSFGIPTEFILNWGRLHLDETDLTVDEVYTFMIDRFNETVTSSN